MNLSSLTLKLLTACGINHFCLYSTWHDILLQGIEKVRYKRDTYFNNTAYQCLHGHTRAFKSYMELKEAAVAALRPALHHLSADNLIFYQTATDLDCSVLQKSLQQRRLIMVSCVSEQSVCIPTAAMMFCLCAIIAPAVTNGDESVNRLLPTDADNYCSLGATVSTPTETLTRY